MLEDGTLCQSCKLARETRTRLRVASLGHHPSSPDLNPIENLWHLLKTKVSQLPTRVTNLDTLWEQVQACWVGIDQGYIDKLIDEMPVSLEAVRKARGEVIQF